MRIKDRPYLIVECLVFSLLFSASRDGIRRSASRSWRNPEHYEEFNSLTYCNSR
ncbi:MAG: hypothetical protein ACYDEF_03475 [Methanosarcina sp.]